MPRLFSYNDFAGGSEIVRSYADKHSPVVICDGQANYNQPFTVKVRIGKTVKHPNSQEHHFRYIQLWNPWLERSSSKGKITVMTLSI